MENTTDTSPVHRRLEGIEEMCTQIIAKMEEELTSLVEAYRDKGMPTASMVETLSRFPKKLNAYKGEIHHELFLLKIGAHLEYGDGKNIDADRANRQIQPNLIWVLSGAQDWLDIDLETWKNRLDTPA
jgi:hypothetical protein